jgi:hypothetical protein
MVKGRRSWARRAAGVGRDTVLFTVGLGLIIHEAVLRDGPERPGLLLLYAGMVGLPAIVRAEASRPPNGTTSDDEGRP